MEGLTRIPELEAEASGEGPVSVETGLTQTGIMAKTPGPNRDLLCPRHISKQIRAAKYVLINQK